jgi:hypothetical protein
VLFAIGAILVGFVALDALWTTLWVDGHSGPFTRRYASIIRRGLFRAMPRDNHKLLSLTGPVVLVANVLAWVVLLWLGWFVLFASDPGSVVRAKTGEAAGAVDRLYFVGYTMVTIGNGDFAPRGGFWQFATSATGLSGLFLLTLAVTYLLAIIEAVVAKRSFASHVWALGHSPQSFVLHAWNGAGFPSLDLLEQLNLVTEQHQAYPLLHYYHESRLTQSVSVGVAVFDDMLTILEHGVEPGVRPSPALVHCARESLSEFLTTLEDAYIRKSEEAPPRIELDSLRAGIPVVSDGTLALALRAREDHRRLIPTQKIGAGRASARRIAARLPDIWGARRNAESTADMSVAVRGS